MRVIVVGAGAMGGLYGAMFKAAGNDTAFLEVNPAVVEAIERDGLEVTRSDGSVERYRIPASTSPDDLSPADIVLFQTKGYATAAAAELARPVVGPGTAVLTLQNGLGNEEVLRAAYPANPIVIGMTVHSVAVLGPGRIHHTGVRSTTVGPSDERAEDATDRVAEALAGSGFPVEREDGRSIRRGIWSKFVLNCASLPILSVTGLPTAAINALDPLLALSDALVRETCAIARAEGIALDADERVGFLREIYRTAGGKASMLQDLEAGRRTEIDTINGAAVRVADRHGLPAPLNHAMVGLVKGREAALGIA